jgi:hypothetical protein
VTEPIGETAATETGKVKIITHEYDMPLSVFHWTKGADEETITELIDETATDTGNIKMITQLYDTP